MSSILKTWVFSTLKRLAGLALRAMYLLYSFLLALGMLMLLPLFMASALRGGYFLAGWRQRFGNLPKIEADGQPVIWLHCVSVREAQNARPVVRALLDTYPSHTLVISTTTLTGQLVASDVFGAEVAAVFYFPFDWAWCVRRALRTVKPTAVIIQETELWPRFLSECEKRAVPVAILNGQISERSYRRYRQLGVLCRHTVNKITLAIMQSEADAKRMAALGLPDERIRVSHSDDYINSSGQFFIEEFKQYLTETQGQSSHSPRVKLIRPPGYRLYRVACFLFSKKKVIGIISPLISDWREEHYEAVKDNELWRARWINIRYYWAFVKVFGLDKVLSMFRKMTGLVKS